MSCKFCRYDLKPFREKNITNVVGWSDANKILQKEENRTCSFCFKKYKNMVIRKQHEMNIHLSKEKKNKCDQCDKSYIYKKYHKEAVHMETRYSCDLCGSKFTSMATKMRHQKSLHNKRSQIDCDICGDSFEFEFHLTRHHIEHHLRSKLNLDFCNISHLTFQCDQCEEKFKRRTHLVSHKETVHCRPEDLEKYKCSNFEEIFPEKTT